MRHFSFGVAAAAAFALSTSAQAQDDYQQRFYAKVGNWQVLRLKTANSGCHTFQETAAGNLYGVTYAIGRPVMLSFTLPNVASTGQTQRKLEVRFVPRAGQQEQSWGRHNFTAVGMETGGTIFLSELLAANFLDPFAASGAMRVYADGQLLTALPLDGATPAIAKLRECAAATAAPPR